MSVNTGAVAAVPGSVREGVDYLVQRLPAERIGQSVVARADIADAHGIILVRKGEVIDASAVERLLDYQLIIGQRFPIPISHLIRFDKLIDGKQLFHRCYALFGKYPDLLTMHKQVSSDDQLSHWTVGLQLPEVLWQQLTLLEAAMPERLDEALFCAWFSALLASNLGFDRDGVCHAFLAGLLRDIGFLNVSAAVLEKTDKLTPEEWRSIQGHVEFSRRCLECATEIPRAVVEAVAQHHERHDGSGYPRRLVGSAVSRLGLIVGLADTLQAMRFKQFVRVGRGLYDAVPYLQMNGAAHSTEVANAAITLLRASGLSTTPQNSFASVSEFAFKMMERARKLLTQIEYLEQILDALRILPLNQQDKSLIDNALQVQTMIASSGLTRGELITWLESMQGADDSSIVVELNELDLMLNELHWHVQKLTRSIDAFFDTHSGKVSAQTHKAVDAAATGLKQSIDSK